MFLFFTPINDKWHPISIYGNARRYPFQMHLIIFSKKSQFKKMDKIIAQVFCRCSEGKNDCDLGNTASDYYLSIILMWLPALSP